MSGGVACEAVTIVYEGSRRSIGEAEGDRRGKRRRIPIGYPQQEEQEEDRRQKRRRRFDTEEEEEDYRLRMSGSETGSEGVGGGRGGGPGDLASRTIVLESKRFYLDVKENTRGRFIKIAEISADGRKNQILMTLPTAAQFRHHLVAFIDAYAELEPVDPNRLHQGELRSEVMFKEDKKYHIDLKVSSDLVPRCYFNAVNLPVVAVFSPSNLIPFGSR